MRKFKRGCLILSLALLGNLPFNSYCSSHWDEFLRQPNKDALVTLEKIIRASPERCSPNIAPMQRHRKQLFELIQGGNPFAFSAAMLVSRCWDGGDLEDFYRTAGSFFEIEPRAFLQIVRKRAISDSELRYLLTMLPLDTVDNFDRKISVVENRIKILKSLTDEPLSEMKWKGLSFLEKEKEDLQRIKKEMDKRP
jgi:hypothetical protein